MVEKKDTFAGSAFSASLYLCICFFIFPLFLFLMVMGIQSKVLTNPVVLKPSEKSFLHVHLEQFKGKFWSNGFRNCLHPRVRTLVLEEAYYKDQGNCYLSQPLGFPNLMSLHSLSIHFSCNINP